MKYLIVLLLIAPCLVRAQTYPTLQTSASIDLLAPFSFNSDAENKLDLRTAELAFSGSLDSNFDGHLNFASHNEDGEFKLEVHEAYISSTKFLTDSRFKVGKFFLDVGILNQVPQHDWSFISAPRVQADFFADEGVSDSGGEVSISLPTASFWDLTFGLTNGYTFGESEDAPKRPVVPTHYIHPVNSIALENNSNLQWGLSYLGRTDADHIQTQLYGIDFTYKRDEANSQKFLFQAEIWYRNLNSTVDPRTEEVGAYFFPQISLREKMYFGLRVDLFHQLNRISESDGESQTNLNYTFVPTLTYQISPMTLVRTAYTLDTQTYERESNTVEQKIEFQWIAFIGDRHVH